MINEIKTNFPLTYYDIQKFFLKYHKIPDIEFKMYHILPDNAVLGLLLSYLEYKDIEYDFTSISELKQGILSAIIHIENEIFKIGHITRNNI